MPQIPGLVWDDESSSSPKIPGLKWDDEEEKEPDIPWYHQAASLGLRTIPAVAGGILGSGLPVIGNLGLGAAGAAVGNVLGQAYEGWAGTRKDFNPYELGIETALGAVPGGFLLKGPGKAATAAALRNYAIKAPIGGAVEGAILGAAGTPFQNWAQTGDMSFEGAGTNALYGAGFGGATGAAFGTRPAIKQARGLEAIANAPTPTPPAVDVAPPPTAAPPPPQGEFDFGEAEPQLPWHGLTDELPQPIEGPEVGPYGTGVGQERLPMETETGQMELDIPLTRNEPDPAIPFGKTVKGDDNIEDIVEVPQPTQAKIEYFQSIGYEPYGRNNDEVPLMIRRKQPPVGPTGPAPTQPQAQAGPPVVSLKGLGEQDIAMWKAKGYTPGGRGPDGYAQLKAPVVGPTAPQQAPVQTPTGTVKGGVPFNEEGGLVIQRSQLSVRRVKDLERQGWRLWKEGPNGEGIFKRAASEFEPMESRRPPEEVMETLRQMLGREPTREEVQRAVDRQAVEGEPTGQVAEFDPDWVPVGARTPQQSATPIHDLINAAGPAPRAGIPPQGPGDIALPPGRGGLHAAEPGIDIPASLPEGQLGLPIIRGQNQIENISQVTPEQGVQTAAEWGPVQRSFEFAQGRPPVTEEPMNGIVPSDYEPQESRRGPTREQMQATDEGYAVLPPGYTGPFDNHVVIRTLSDGSRVIDPRRTVEGTLYPEPEIPKTPQEMRNELRNERLQRRNTPPYISSEEMRVPGVHEGRGGLENVALGGADPRVWDVVGSSLYARKRPVTTVKELLQNAWDEHKEIGVKEPVRVLIDSTAKNPRGGPNGKSITVRDRGRGLSPENIYTYLTNLGSTGKAGVQSAAGGFGFAKAAPFTGGKFTRVRSVVIDPETGQRIMYSFEGNPSELKNQRKGVPLNAEIVGNDIPTGLEVTTFYDQDIPGFYDTAAWARNMAERSPSVETPTKIAEVYGADPIEARRWLDETPQNPIKSTEWNYLANHQSKDYSPQPVPSLVDTIDTPGADIKVHYDIPPGSEASEANLHMTNKGMYQGSKSFNYGESTPNVPRSIVVDIISKVEEGHDLYPFSANREQLSDDVDDAINKWVRDNIITGVTQKRIAEIQKQYDGIAPLHPRGETKLDYLDEGNLLTPDELRQIAQHPRMIQGLKVLESIHKKVLEVADSLGWTPQQYGATWTYPSERLKKFGILFKAPDAKGTVEGIHIPRPDDMNNSAILINIMELLNKAAKHGSPVDQLVSDIIVTLAHEDAHIPGGGHDKGHSYRDADLRGRFGGENTIAWLKELEGAFGDGKGGIDQEISNLLQVYNGSRQRASGGPNALLATGISSTRQPDTGRGTTGNVKGARGGQAQSGSVGGRGPDEPFDIGKYLKEQDPEKKGPTKLQEYYNLARGLTTTLDFSAPLRQGLPLIFTKQWWKSWKQMGQAWGNEGAYKKTLSDIRKREMFQPKWDETNNKIIPSLADQARVKILDLNEHMNSREESIASGFAETGKMFGEDNVVQRGYQKTLGRAVRKSNRAYQAFLNQLRADTFESLVKDAKRDFDAGTQGARDPYTDLPFLQELGDFVNTATGRGPLRTYLGGKEEFSLEQHARLFTNTIFSPRLFASRVRMLNPGTYVMASPFVRKQYAKALLGVAGAWGTTTALALAAKAGGYDVEVSGDTNSADFGKIRIGNTRLDPAGGFQQYLVAASRFITGEITSSGSNRQSELGAGYRAETRKDVIERFGVNKLHPVMKFAYDILNASERTPFQVADRTAQMFIPLLAQDVWELYKEDPSLIPFILPPVAAGMGTQTYEKGEAKSRFFPKEYDWNFQGGNLWDADEPEGPQPIYPQ